jgi:hypothetical protein
LHFGALQVLSARTAAANSASKFSSLASADAKALDGNFASEPGFSFFFLDLTGVLHRPGFLHTTDLDELKTTVFTDLNTTMFSFLTFI